MYDSTFIPVLPMNIRVKHNIATSVQFKIWETELVKEVAPDIDVYIPWPVWLFNKKNSFAFYRYGCSRIYT